jgi:hypothetical protein
MHDKLEQALQALGIAGTTPRLHDAAQESAETLVAAKAWLTEKVPPQDAIPLDVVVAGSMARGEASEQSDFDYFVIAHGVPQPEQISITRDLMAAADAFIEEKLERGQGTAGSRQPGTSGLFGRIFAAADLTERIGLEQDTNISHSRRQLLLQESASVYRADLHADLKRAILARYLVDYPPGGKEGTPRFLLNDVARYWYTMAVDYQAKRWEKRDAEWGLRYLKLITSRKMSIAGTLVSLLLCSEETPATLDILYSQFDMPPLARLGQLALDDRFEQKEALKTAFEVAEDFSVFLASPEKRGIAKAIMDFDEMEMNSVVGPMLTRARQLQASLEKIFFESFLGPDSRRYLLL